MNLVPIGVIGELYIGGAELARGYLNRIDLTVEKFVANPFLTEQEYEQGNKNLRLYRTGDLVRYQSDGNLEYIGRNDFQVKIRGYRIECGEIESVLSNYKGIRQSIVIAKKHTNTGKMVTGDKYLVGYYVSDSQLDEEAILNYLHTKLPKYMIPVALVHLEKLPLTITGKLDRNALPDPELTSNDRYMAPRNKLEERICQIWGEVLGLDKDKVSIREDFFRLGGNSILAIRLVSKINTELNSSISVASIFKFNTIDRLVYHVVHNIEDLVAGEEYEF
jgi:long-subunit acyl-CoA synthetase (AMP-forming)